MFIDDNFICHPDVRLFLALEEIFLIYIALTSMRTPIGCSHHTRTRLYPIRKVKTTESTENTETRLRNLCVLCVLCG